MKPPFPPMHSRAELWRRPGSPESIAARAQAERVARGTLVIMAYAMASLPEAERQVCTIVTAFGDFDAAAVEAMLRHWCLTPASDGDQ